MKKYILILIVILNTSFIEIPKRYWVGTSCTTINSNGRIDNYYGGFVIEAATYKEAVKIFKKRLRKVPQLKKVVFNKKDWNVHELKKEDILK